RTAVRVRRVVLPRRDPVQHRVEHLVRAQDRVLVSLPLTEGGVDEVAVHPNAQPQRTEMAEDDLPFGGLAEQAHVGDPAVRDEIAGPGGVASVLSADRVAVLRLLDLAADRREQNVAPQTHGGVLQCAHGLDVAGERALHVRDAEPVEAAVSFEGLRLEARDVAQPRLPTGVRGVHVPVEHQRRAASGSRPGTERVRAIVLDLLPLHLQSQAVVDRDHQVGHALLVAREAVHVHHLARRVDEPVAVDLHARKCGSTFSPKSRICSCRFAPHSSSMTWVQPASRYSSIAAMQSSGVPAIGLHLSSSASVTLAFAASRPPCSIASATGRISSWSIPASSSSVSAAPWMFCTLFARYIPAISRAPSRPSSRSAAWIEATTVQPMSMSAATFLRV